MRMATTRLTSPVKGRAQSGAGAYGWRTHPVDGGRSFHGGQDVACPIGTPILAPEPGVVLAVGWAGSGLAAYRTGIFMLMRGDWTGRDHYFGHCSETTVRAGRRVAQLEQLALSGNTGNSSGPHCHIETRTAGTLTTHDPAPFYAARGVALGSTPPPPEDEMAFTEAQLEQMAANGVVIALRGTQGKQLLRALIREELASLTRGDATAVAKEVWRYPVWRNVDGERTPVPAIQELADAKTAATRNLDLTKKGTTP